ncbi:MAG: four helix bundle protein [Verrucomicrobiota bacterium]|nr:four helix bundle protein [Verrucomicrobiota bacterium]
MTSLKVYDMAEKLADEVWTAVMDWENAEQATVGAELVKTTDNIGAAIAEALGRRGFQGNRRAIRLTRGYLKAAEHYMRRAYRRKLLADKEAATLKSSVDELTLVLDAYLARAGASNKEADAPTPAPKSRNFPPRDRGYRSSRG